MCCGKCSKGLGLVLVALGILFVLGDLGIWNFWGLSWWSVAFLLAGLSFLGSACCSGCQDSCCGSCECPEEAPKAKPKRK